MAGEGKVLQGKFSHRGYSPNEDLRARLDRSPRPATVQRSHGRRLNLLPADTLRLGGQGSPLPTPTRHKLEGFFGADFSTVRVHEDGQAASIGAEAFACGEDLYFSPGAYRPFEKNGMALLAHELTHVVQQREGRTPTSGGASIAVLEDAALELEAELNAHDLVQEPSARNGRGRRRAPPGPGARGPAGGAAATVQPRMVVAGAAPATDAAAELQAIATAAGLTADVHLQAGWQAIHTVYGDDVLTAVIAGWIGGGTTVSAKVWEALGYTPPPARSWDFTNYEQALRILVAETLRPKSEKLEAALADQVLASPAVLEGVRRYVTRVRRYANRIMGAGHRPADWLKTTSIYSYYYNSYASTGLSLLGLAKTTTIQDVLDNPADYPLDYLMAAIKDTTQKFWDWFAAGGAPAIASQSINVPAGRSNAHYLDAHGAPQVETIATVRPAALDEDSATMRYIRAKGMLVDHGPSYSTGRMMQLGRAAGALDAELEAVAWGIFAFWNKKYWRATSGIHCWHFVMDMLRNYVPGFNSLAYPTSLATGMSAGLTALGTAPLPQFQLTLQAMDVGWVAP